MSGANGNGNGTLNLDPADVARTMVPVERATMLPPAAFTDPSVLEWEIDEIFSAAGSAWATSPPSPSRAST